MWVRGTLAIALCWSRIHPSGMSSPVPAPPPSAAARVEGWRAVFPPCFAIIPKICRPLRKVWAGAGFLQDVSGGGLVNESR